MTETEFEQLCVKAFAEICSRARSTNEVQFLTSYFAFHRQFEHNILSYITEYEFNEVLELIDTFKALEDAEVDEKTKTRIRMFLYCHIIEVDLIYMILFNMLRTIKNEKYSSIISFVSKSGRVKEADYPIDKIELLVNESEKIGIPLKAIYSELFFNQLRNAFSHSEYFLDNDGGLNISKNLSPATSAIQKKPTQKTYFTSAEIQSIFNKSILYLKSFINVHKSYIEEFMDGKPRATLFGNIYFDEESGWGFVQ
jgi:hypothetical protein